MVIRVIHRLDFSDPVFRLVVVLGPHGVDHRLLGPINAVFKQSDDVTSVLMILQLTKTVRLAKARAIRGELEAMVAQRFGVLGGR